MNFISNIAFKSSILSLAVMFMFANLNCSFSKEYNESEFEEEFIEDFEELGSHDQKLSNSDPLEPVNRKIFALNEAFDKHFFEHVARTYRLIIPKQARSAIRNFLDNLSKPVSFVNSVAQGKVNNSLATLSSFLINSTIGVLGIFDIADSNGIEYRKEDFGQTLGYYGVNTGIYLVIPFKGPSSLRDFSGWITDSTVNPIGFNVFQVGQRTDFIDNDTRIGIGIMSAVDTREGLINIIDDIRQDSFDPYVTIRSAYLQNRIEQIKR